jgi:hypothetical protein
MTVTTFIYVRRMTHMPAIQVRFGALPNALILSGLPRNEGGFGCLGSADNIQDVVFSQYFSKLAAMSGPALDIIETELAVAVDGLYRWLEENFVNEDKLRHDIITSQSPLGNGVYPVMKEWASDRLDPSKWPAFQC